MNAADYIKEWLDKAYDDLRVAQYMPKTHDLETLAMMCAEYDKAFDAFMDKAKELAGYAVASSYPNQLEIAEDQTGHALKAAGKVYEYCAALIHQQCFSEQEQPQSGQ
ncbi:MAG: HEPN domain-containing protein, partial [Gracilibacteraceae bacterium]|nr:HEPN domain-containing protein [Gracilibacteraceae bacterium]